MVANPRGSKQSAAIIVPELAGGLRLPWRLRSAVVCGPPAIHRCARCGRYLVVVRLSARRKPSTPLSKTHSGT
jgi:hypothetical protein